MNGPITVLQHLEAALRRSCSFDRNDRVPPAALLWPDKSGEWTPAAERLSRQLPLVALGEYDGERTGPAIWIRCVVERTLGEIPESEIPIVYLPGIERSDLRAVEECPAELQPLAELQYRGAFFGSRAGRDWTTAAFFSNRDEGLAVAVARDAETEGAFARAMPTLLDEPVESLRQKSPLRAADLDALLDPDPVRTLLRWLNDPAEFEASVDLPTREAFIRAAREDYGFSPNEDGPIVAAERLGERNGAWKNVWERFVEIPSRYLGVIQRLRQARPQTILVAHSDSWPQDNEDAERDLHAALAAVCDRPVEQVRAEVVRLEEDHGKRRGWVWAALGEAPLAEALAHLAALACSTESQLSGETPMEIAEAYASGGWQVDSAALLALASVEAATDRFAVEGAVTALYRPWADACARRFQAAVVSHDATDFGSVAAVPDTGECVLFIDGLRFDLGGRLADLLRSRGVDVELGWQLAALPSLTATAKPAVSPAAPKLSPGEGFATTIAGTGQTITADLLRRTIAATGIDIVVDQSLVDPTASGWAEFGNVDEIGHSHADRFPHAVAAQVRDIADRVLALLDAGWRTIRIVTDHGWLYLPGGLEKANLPEHLTATRKGRAARLVDGASGIDHPVVPWRWDPNVRVAVAPGLTCYVAGRIYEHGGLSPQECVTPVVTVRRPDAAFAVSITDVSWVGMRSRVTIDGAATGFLVDVRTKAASSASSKLEAPVPVGDGGAASALVVDPDAEGQAAFVVALAADGSLLAQRSTTIGGAA